jgi:hypothetical protein
MNKAGWHTVKKLVPHDNVTLNLQEQIWEWLRSNHFCNRFFKNHNDIVDASCNAWNDLTSKVGLIKSISSREWAYV